MRSKQAFTAPAHQRVLPGCYFSRQDSKWNIYPHAYSPGFIVMDWLLRAGREPEGHVFSSSRSPSSSSLPSFCSKRGNVVEWLKRFLEGFESLEDDARPGKAHRVIIPEMIAEVNALVLDNHRITVYEIHREKYGFLSQIVTGDETLCHPFEPESKRQSKQWKRATSSLPKKPKVIHTSSGKVMMSFFDRKGPLLVELLERGITDNVQRYQAT
ncbi:histone-lysine N-methyltransferase SETMAR [Trichonephila clavipes]|nr:histone-lysine N-methyltransferase SETMAR [Trichonephila clavipes]